MPKAMTQLSLGVKGESDSPESPKEFSPKSIEASSKLLSKPSILEIKISIQKGVQKRI